MGELIMTDQPPYMNYCVAVDKSNGVDYGCEMEYYIDENGQLHIVAISLEPPKEKQQDET